MPGIMPAPLPDTSPAKAEARLPIRWPPAKSMPAIPPWDMALPSGDQALCGGDVGDAVAAASGELTELARRGYTSGTAGRTRMPVPRWPASTATPVSATGPVEAGSEPTHEGAMASGPRLLNTPT